MMKVTIFSHNYSRIWLEKRREDTKSVKKVVIGWLILTVSLCAQLHYVAKGTLVGTIADIKVTHQDSGRAYRIDIVVTTSGVAKMMSGGLREHHISYGRVVKGEYYASEYTIEKHYKDIRYKRSYRFDYKRKKIVRTATKWKKGKQLYRIQRELRYFAHNDILTLYHNIMRLHKSHKSGTYTIKLAGAEKERGKLRYTIPSPKALAKARSRLGGKALDVVQLHLNREFLSGGKGMLMLGMDQEGITQKGLLERVKVLGSVTLKRIK